MPTFATVILVDRLGRLLLQERDEHPVIDPECWGMPGGHVEQGETFEVAAYRELAEETGVELPAGTLRSYGEFTVWHEAYESWDTVGVFVASTDLSDAHIECNEGRQMTFVHPHRIAELPLTGSAATIVPTFLESDTYRKLLP